MLATLTVLAAPAAAAPKPNVGFTVTLGAGLIIIAFAAQFIIWKRLKDAKLRKLYSWIAWIADVLGGTAITLNVDDKLGVTSWGAFVASLVMLLFIAADLKDRRPDWPAFILIAICPSFLKVVSGPLGALCDLLLMPPTWVVNWLSTAVM